MIFSSRYIDIIHKLGEAGLFKDPKGFILGSCLLRGYADLGKEQFLVTGTNKLSSLFTGVQSMLPEGHEHFFTKIPATSELVQQITVRDYDIVEAAYQDNRSWHLKAENLDKTKTFESKDPEFEVALAQLLLNIL